MTQITCDGSTQGVPQVVILAQQQLRWFKTAGYYICAGPIGVQVIEVEEIDKEPAPVACRTWSEVGPDAAKAIIDDARARLINLVLDHVGMAAGADPHSTVAYKSRGPGWRATWPDPLTFQRLREALVPGGFTVHGEVTSGLEADT